MRRLFIVIAAYLFAKTYAVSVFSELPDNFTHVTWAVIGIINSCYANEARNVILTGSIDDPLMSAFTRSNELLKVAIQNTPYDHDRTKNQLDNHASLYVVVATSNNELETHFKILETLPQWSVNEHHFILSKPEGSNGCKKAFEFLRFIWSINLLSTIFMCYQDDQVNIYGFNPFVNVAPIPWLPAETEAFEVPPWTLFKRSYSKDLGQENCDNLFWDKTKKLNGYDVNVVAIEATGIINVQSHNKNHITLTGCDGSVMQDVFTFMNATVVLASTPLGVPGIDDEGNPFGFFTYISSGEKDIILNAVFTKYLKNATISPTHYQSGDYFFLQKKGPMSTAKKIVQYLGWKLLLATACVTLTTLVFFKYISRQTFTYSTFEAIRLLSTAGLLNIPPTVPSRLYFANILIFYLIFHALFQGKLAALLTISVPEPNLNNEQDLLAHPEYKLYALDYYASYLSDLLKPNVIITNDLYCNKCFLQDPYCVCITQSILSQIIALTYDLHLSAELLTVQPLTYVMSMKWPLQNRFKEVISRLTESHIVARTISDEVEKFRKTIFKDLYKETGPTPITLDQLMFAFKFLGFGLTCASIVFLIEIKIWNFGFVLWKKLNTRI